MWQSLHLVVLLLQVRVLVLLHREDQLFKKVLEELLVLAAGEFTLAHPRVQREQARLVELLGLEKSVDPLLLALLHHFDLVLLLDEAPLVLFEVAGANILNLVELLVILILQSFAVGACSARRLQHKRLETLSLEIHTATQFILNVLNALMQVIPDTRDLLIEDLDLLGAKLIDLISSCSLCIAYLRDFFKHRVPNTIESLRCRIGILRH